MTNEATQEWIERNRVVEVAKSWLGTPYHHMGQVKKGGVDCLTLLACVFEEAELISKIKIPYYPRDWMHHRDAERYLEGLLQYSKEISGPPRPGDIALWKTGRCYAHGAIVTSWPEIIHAQAGCMVMLDDAEKTAWLTHIGEHGSDFGKPRPVRFFSFWGK